jgi:hypothetical protein
MPRIRSIHPGIFTDEAFMSASAQARLLIIGLWCEAWDDGVFEWKPLTLKARLFPVDSVDMKALLQELQDLRFVTRFSSNDREYGAIRNFQKYQRPKKPNSSGALPNSLASYVSASGTGSETVGNQFGTGGENSPQMEDGGGRGEEEEEEQHSVETPAPPERKPALDDRTLEAALREASGLENDPSPNLHVVGPIHALIGEGYDLEKHILPVLKSLRRRGKRWSNWQYVVPAVRERNAAPAAMPGQAPPSPDKPVDPDLKRKGQLSRAKDHLRDGRWSANLGPRRGEPGCRIPEEIWQEAEQIIQAEKTALEEALRGKPNGVAAHH